MKPYVHMKTSKRHSKLILADQARKTSMFINSLTQQLVPAHPHDGVLLSKLLTPNADEAVPKKADVPCAP